MQPAVLLFILGFTFAVPACGQQLPRCGDARVSYSANLPELAAKIHVLRLTSATAPASSLKKELTPQGTRWLVAADADYMKAGPWNTTYFVGAYGSERPVLKLEIDDHGNTISARWINEKLLFVEVWWGRFGATDLILDVESRRLVYSEFAHYGDLAEPCRDE